VRGALQVGETRPAGGADNCYAPATGLHRLMRNSALSHWLSTTVWSLQYLVRFTTDSRFTTSQKKTHIELLGGTARQRTTSASPSLLGAATSASVVTACVLRDSDAPAAAQVCRLRALHNRVISRYAGLANLQAGFRAAHQHGWSGELTEADTDTHEQSRQPDSRRQPPAEPLCMAAHGSG